MILESYLDVLSHSYSPSSQEAEAEAAKVWVQPGLHGKTLSQKKIINLIFNIFLCESNSTNHSV